MLPLVTLLEVACFSLHQMAEQVQAQLKSVSKGELDAPHKEFARVMYNDECEAAINEQIK